MYKKKYRVILTQFEQRLFVRVLAEFRNQLLSGGKPTEEINNLILKVIDAPIYKWWR